MIRTPYLLGGESLIGLCLLHKGTPSGREMQTYPLSLLPVLVGVIALFPENTARAHRVRHGVRKLVRFSASALQVKHFSLRVDVRVHLAARWR